MAAPPYCRVYQSLVPPRKLFTALTENFSSVLPNTVDTIKKAEIFQVDGVEGINVVLTSCEGDNFRHILLRFYEIDKINMSFKYNLFQGPARSLMSSYDVKVKPARGMKLKPARGMKVKPDSTRGSIITNTVNCCPNIDPARRKIHESEMILPESGIIELIESLIAEKC